MDLFDKSRLTRFGSHTGHLPDQSTGLQINMAKLGTVPNASNSAKLGGLLPGQVLHGTSLTGGAQFLALTSGPVLAIPGVGTVGVNCLASDGGFDWTITTTGADTYAAMPVTEGDGFFPIQPRYDDTNASATYDPKSLNSSHTVTIHGGSGAGSPGSVNSEAVAQLVPVSGWAGTPVTLILTGIGANPQNTCTVRAFAQLWG